MSKIDFKKNDLVEILIDGVYTDDGDYLQDIKNNLGIITSIKVYHRNGYDVINKLSFKNVISTYKTSYAIAFEVFIEGNIVAFKDDQIKKIFSKS